MSIHRSSLGVLLALTLVMPVAVARAAVAQDAAGSHAGCRPRTLVLSAMPVELTPLLRRASITRTVTVGSREFLVGRLAGRRVVLALTGIGPVNARRTTRQAFDHVGCIDTVLFSGVAGGDDIGDVIVPTHWTTDGKHRLGVSRGLRRAAAHARRTRLERVTPAGDPACACVTDPGLVKAVRVTHRPRVEIGGTGQTTDPFSGKALPCAPGGGDVFGCDPCPLPKHPAQDASTFAAGIAPFLDPAFLAGYSSPSESGNYVVEDEETAAVDAVAHARHRPDHRPLQRQGTALRAGRR